MIRRPGIAALVVHVCLSSGLVQAQTTTATLLGAVTDAQGGVVPGATVTARNVGTGVETTAVADGNGRYRLGALRPGAYEIRVELAGFGTQIRQGVELYVGQEATIDFQLSPSAVEETVTVLAAAPLVETTKSEVSSVIERQRIDELPLVNRNFANLTLLTPGVVSGDRIGGMESSLSNTYLIDGVTNDRGWTGGARAGYSAENIREFRVITQQFAAEYGQASGGIVNVVTRSGSNAFEQRAFLFHRDDRLDARNAFAVAKAPFDRQQFGGFAGGPIRRDRLFYFGSYEGLALDETAVVSTRVESGEYPRPTRQHQFFGKGDYQLARDHALTVRYSHERNETRNAGVGGRSLVEYGTTSYFRNHDVYGALTSVLGGTRLNELRAAWSRRPGGAIPNTPEGPELLFASANRGKPASAPNNTVEQRVQLVNNFTWTVSGWGGEHAFKAGVDVSRVRLEGFFCNFCDGQFTFPRDVYDPADPATYPTQYQRRLGSSDFVITNNIYALFVQDSWRPTDRLTVNAGLRYDYESYNGQLDDRNNFSPRLALSFDPRGNGRSVVRGGAGIFQDQVTLNQWLIIVLNVINAREFIVLSNPSYPDPFGGTPRPPGPPNVELFDPGMNTPYAVHVTGGFKQELWPGTAISADYTHVRGLHQLRRRDLNAPPDGTNVRPNPAFGRQLIHESTGRRSYHALLVNFEKRMSARWRFTGAYTLSSTKADSEARNSVVLPTNQYNLRADWGPADADARHNVVLSGVLLLPWDLQASGIFQYRSPFPFNVVSGRDTNNDGRTGDRPDPDPNGPFPTNGVTAYGRFSIPVNRPGTLPRNAFRGPNYMSMDLRLSRAFRFDRRRLEVIAEAFNVTNRVNYGPYTGSIQSAFFGRPQSALDPRQIQLGLRFDF